jgi:thymidine phosphorylase
VSRRSQEASHEVHKQSNETGREVTNAGLKQGQTLGKKKKIVRVQGGYVTERAAMSIFCLHLSFDSIL